MIQPASSERPSPSREHSSFPLVSAIGVRQRTVGFGREAVARSREKKTVTAIGKGKEAISGKPKQIKRQQRKEDNFERRTRSNDSQAEGVKQACYAECSHSLVNNRHCTERSRTLPFFFSSIPFFHVSETSLENGSCGIEWPRGS